MAFETGVSAGWTLYFPLAGIDFSYSHAVSLAILFLPLLGASSEADATTFLAILQLSRNSVYLLELRLCRLSNFLVSILLVTTLPILGAGITVLFFFRKACWLFGLSGLCLDAAGDAVAFQHLFWFFGHPEVYVIVLPAFGVISASLEGLRQQPTPSYFGMALCSLEHRRCGLLCLSSHVRSDERLFFVYNSCHWCSYGREDIRLITCP